jgi:hypothetical protein
MVKVENKKENTIVDEDLAHDVIFGMRKTNAEDKGTLLLGFLSLLFRQLEKEVIVTFHITQNKSTKYLRHGKRKL